MIRLARPCAHHVGAALADLGSDMFGNQLSRVASVKDKKWPEEPVGLSGHGSPTGGLCSSCTSVQVVHLREVVDRRRDPDLAGLELQREVERVVPRLVQVAAVEPQPGL